MIKTKDITAIELGPRQLLFGFEDHLADRQAFIVDSVKTMVETRGQVFMDHFVEHTEQIQGWSCSDILQQVFWAADELRIHFRWNGCMLAPFEAKRHLLKSPEHPVELVINKEVRASVFQEAALIHRTITTADNQEHLDDQYQLALSLLLVYDHWKHLLISFAGKSQMPFYPGRELISQHLKSLDLLMAKKDSYSLLSNCCKYSDIIVKMAEDVETLSVFYSEHLSFWEDFIQSMGDFEENLAEIREYPEIWNAHEQLNQILISDFPYKTIFKAKQLLAKVCDLNHRILEKKIKHCRRNALDKIDTMIDHLSGLFERFDTKLDNRNQMLYPLHMQKKRLGAVNSRQEIEKLLNQALDRADDFITELEDDKGDDHHG